MNSAGRKSISALHFTMQLVAINTMMVAPIVTSAQSVQDRARARADSAIRLSNSLVDSSQYLVIRGVLVAEGDSWFAYPGTNLIKELERLGYAIESNAENGSHLEEMAYSVDRLSDFHSKLRKAKAKWTVVPKAILLSGGGNDIVNEPLALMLNHASANKPPLDTSIAHALIDVRLADAIKAWILTTQRLVEDVYGKTTRIPVLMHGYDFAVPDGRGYKKYSVTWAGPWMKPEFEQRGYEDLAQTTRVIESLITRYNAMLMRLASDTALNLRYVKLTGKLNKPPTDHREWWDNELHPEKKGFRLLVEEYGKAIPGH